MASIGAKYTNLPAWLDESRQRISYIGMTLNSLPDHYRAIVFGATGGIGRAFVAHLQQDPRCEEVVALSRSTTPAMDFNDESSLSEAAKFMKEHGSFHLMLDATGVLSNDEMQPEKALRDIDVRAMQQSYLVNAIGPALLLKHFHGLLPREGKAIFASLSAKVGSIGDNQIGGWYSYRASKAALNMILKNAAIELGRKYKELVVLGLHPGTVDTSLSENFRNHINHEVFSPEYATKELLRALDAVDASQSGRLMAYDGSIIEW